MRFGRERKLTRSRRKSGSWLWHDPRPARPAERAAEEVSDEDLVDFSDEEWKWRESRGDRTGE